MNLKQRLNQLERAAHPAKGYELDLSHLSDDQLRKHLAIFERVGRLVNGEFSFEDIEQPDCGGILDSDSDT